MEYASYRGVLMFIFCLLETSLGFPIKMELSSPKPDTTTTKPPILITIGPQCSGKTTFLRNLADAGLSTVDITLDDQLNVYTPVDTRLFLYNSLEDPTMTRDDRVWLQNQIHGKTIAYRIFQEGGNDELRLVLQRLQGRIDRNTFALNIDQIFERQHQNQNDNNHANGSNDDAIIYQQVARDLIQVVERTVTKNVSLPEVTLLFIVESLFRPNESTGKTGIETATIQLETACRQNGAAVAWGNTNARPRDYRCALDIASSTGRPVIFITNSNVSGLKPECQNGMPMALSDVPFPSLLQRNVDRLQQTGKYVPSKTIWDSMQRSNSLLISAAERAKRERMTTNELDIGNDEADKTIELLHLELDQQLARFVNFEMSPDRTVQPMPFQRSNRKERQQPGEDRGGHVKRSDVPFLNQSRQNYQHQDRTRTYPNRQGNGRASARGYNSPGYVSGSGRATSIQGADFRNYGGKATNSTARDAPSSWSNRGRGNFPAQRGGYGVTSSGGNFQSRPQRAHQPLNTQNRHHLQTRNPPWPHSSESRTSRDNPVHQGSNEQRPNPWFTSQNNQEPGNLDEKPLSQRPNQNLDARDRSRGNYTNSS